MPWKSCKIWIWNTREVGDVYIMTNFGSSLTFLFRKKLLSFSIKNMSNFKCKILILAFNLNVGQNFFSRKKIVENVAAEFEIVFPLHKLRQTFFKKSL